MSDLEKPDRVLRLFCEKVEEAWIVHAGGEWLPAPLKPFFNHHLETSPVFLDFEYLGELARSRGATISIRKTRGGSVAFRATGPDTKVLAMWLGSAMASGLLPPSR